MMQGRNLPKSSLLLLALFGVAGTPQAWSQENLRCISVQSIDRTEVIDDQTIAFFLNGRRIYLNRLNRSCPNLARDRIFSYSTSTGQLCSIDVITIIEDFGGLSRGASCGLGEFEPTDEETLQVLRGETEPIDIEPEEIEVNEAESEDAQRAETENERAEADE